jgi:thioredoxin 1
MEKPGLQSVTSQTFDAEVLQAKLPVVVEFGAVWCAPCRMMEPHLRSLAEEHAGALLVRKVDVDNEPDLADRFDVRSLPTMLVFSRGEVIGRIVGAVPQEKLRRFATAGLAAASGRAA